MDHGSAMLAIIAYFVVSWAFAAYTIHDLLTDKQKNPSSQYACLVKFVLGPPLMAALGWTGMTIAVVISGLVLVGGRYLTTRKG